MNISVIIPVYNVEPYLRACIESVMAAARDLQEGRDEACVEVICVDDGSTDGSGEILDEYVKRFNCLSCALRCVSGEWSGRPVTSHVRRFSRVLSSPLFRVVHQRNAGVSAARNVGLEVAVGEWVTFVDADDIVSPKIFSHFADCLRQVGPEVDIIRFNTVQFKSGKDLGFDVDFSNFSSRDAREELVYAEVAAPLWGAFYKRAILPVRGFEHYCRGEDRLFVGTCLARARTTVRCECVAYAYRQRSGSAMCSKMSVQKLIDRLGYSRDWVNVLTTGGKKVSREIFHEIGVNITEGFLYDLYQIENVTSRKKMWALWYRNLGWMSDVKSFPLWTRSVVRICDFIHFRIVALVLCYLPMWLKHKGFHR